MKKVKKVKKVKMMRKMKEKLEKRTRTERYLRPRGVGRYQQALRGSFWAVSKLIFAIKLKYSFE